MFVAKTALATQLHFSYGKIEPAQHQGSRLGTRGGHSLHTTDYEMTLSNESSGRGGKETFVAIVFLFKGTVTHAEILFSRKCVDICLPLGSREFIYFYALLEHEAFVFPIKQSLSAIKQWVFLPSILSSSHGRGEWARCWVGIWLLAKVNQPQMPFTRIILWFVICCICFLTHFSHIL